jgi:hypothetical protein
MRRYEKQWHEVNEADLHEMMMQLDEKQLTKAKVETFIVT